MEVEVEYLGRWRSPATRDPVLVPFGLQGHRGHLSAQDSLVLAFNRLCLWFGLGTDWTMSCTMTTEPDNCTKIEGRLLGTLVVSQIIWLKRRLGNLAVYLTVPNWERKGFA